MSQYFCQLKGPCYLAVPHREAVSHLWWVFLHHSETLQVVPRPLWTRALELRVLCRVAVCHGCFLPEQFAARAQAGNVFLPVGAPGLLHFVARAGWAVAGGVVRSHTNKIIFGGSTILLCFLQFGRSVGVPHALATRVLLKKQDFFSFSCNMNIWNVELLCVFKRRVVNFYYCFVML